MPLITELSRLIFHVAWLVFLLAREIAYWLRMVCRALWRRRPKREPASTLTFPPAIVGKKGGEWRRA
jgi:hypothetical protein